MTAALSLYLRLTRWLSLSVKNAANEGRAQGAGRQDLMQLLHAQQVTQIVERAEKSLWEAGLGW